MLKGKIWKVNTIRYFIPKRGKNIAWKISCVDGNCKVVDGQIPDRMKWWENPLKLHLEWHSWETFQHKRLLQQDALMLILAEEGAIHKYKWTHIYLIECIYKFQAYYFYNIFSIFHNINYLEGNISICLYFRCSCSLWITPVI